MLSCNSIRSRSEYGQQFPAAETAGRDDREATGRGDADLGGLRGKPELVQIQQRIAQRSGIQLTRSPTAGCSARRQPDPSRRRRARRRSLPMGRLRRRDLVSALSFRVLPRPFTYNAHGARPGDDVSLQCAQRASDPRSPVRTRTTVSTGLTHTLPSPILPVRAAWTMTSTTLSTAESSTKHLDPHLRHEVHRVLRPAVHLGVALLTAVALHLADGHSENPRLLEAGLDVFERERLDDRSNQLHVLPYPSTPG